MKFIGWSILLFNFLLTSQGNEWEYFAGMLLGASIIALGYKLGHR